jgi:MFS family permease
MGGKGIVLPKTILIMRLRKKIPPSQLIDDAGVLVRPGWLLAGLCLAGAAKAFEPSFEIFYPPSAAPFGAGWSLARFLASSWAVILVLFMLAGGTLGDMVGRRKVLLWGLGIMVFTNILLLLSPNTLWHVLWRIPANISTGLILPLTLAPLYIFFDGRQRVIAFAVYIITIGSVGLLSDHLGRLITQSLDWRNVYFLPGLIAITAFFLVRRSLPESRTANPRLIDTILYSSWTILLLGIIYAILELVLGREWIVSVFIIVSVVIAVGLGTLIWWTRHTRGGLNRNTMLHSRHVIVLIVCGVILQIAFVGFFLLTYSFYRVAQNKDLAQSLLSLAPIFIGLLAALLLITRLWAQQEVRRVIGTGFLLLALVISGMALVSRFPSWLHILPLGIFGITIIITKTVWTNAFFQTLIDRYIGLNAGINSATLLVGGALGAVLATELLGFFGQSAFVRNFDSTSLSERAILSLYEDITTTIAAGEQAGIKNLALTIGTNLYSQYQNAYIIAYSLAIMIIAVLCLLAAILIFRGIRASLLFKPETAPLDEPASTMSEAEDELVQMIKSPQD